MRMKSICIYGSSLNNNRFKWTSFRLPALINSIQNAFQLSKMQREKNTHSIFHFRWVSAASWFRDLSIEIPTIWAQFCQFNLYANGWSYNMLKEKQQNHIVAKFLCIRFGTARHFVRFVVQAVMYAFSLNCIQCFCSGVVVAAVAVVVILVKCWLRLR